MKRFLILLSILFCTNAVADTETINWYVDGDTYATTTCQTGGDINLPTTPTKYGYTFQGWRDYIPLEYLESTGTQWIDTGVILNENSKIRAKFLRSSVNCMGIIGSRQEYARNNISIIGDTTNLRGSIIDFNNGSLDPYRLTVLFNYANPIPIVAESSKTLRRFYNPENENVSLNSNTNICPHNFTMTKTALLFNVSGEDTKPLIGRIYYAQIWDNDVLIRDFIPVLDGNNIPCMYDKVEGKFYYNVNNADNFIAGPIIDE